QVESNPIKLNDLVLILKNKPFINLIVIMVFITISQRINDNFIGLYVIELGGTERLIGISWFIAIMSDAIIFATAKFWFRKIHPLIFIIMAGFIYSFRWILYGLVDGPLYVILLQSLN